MMFLSHIAYSLELIALAFGVVLMSCSFNKEEKCIKWVKKIGVLIIILSVLGMICTSYYVFKYWWQGSFETASGMPMIPNNKTMLYTEQKQSDVKSHNMDHLQNMGNIQNMEIPKDSGVHH